MGVGSQTRAYGIYRYVFSLSCASAALKRQGKSDWYENAWSNVMKFSLWPATATIEIESD